MIAAVSVLSVMIVDDEERARSRLRDLLADLAGEEPNEVVAEAPDGLVALTALTQRPVDVVLVDIRMPVMDGMEFAQHLLQLEAPPAVIFVTAYDTYAVRAFDLNAIDYLLKPVRASRLLAALRKARNRLPLSRRVLAQLPQAARIRLSCHERGRLLLIPVEQVIYFRADLKYVVARTADREYWLDESLVHLEQEFGDHFVRLHRSVLAAKEAIRGFERSSSDDSETQWQAILRDIPDRLPVSRRQWPLVKSCVR